MVRLIHANPLLMLNVNIIHIDQTIKEAFEVMYVGL